jgi:hypothetical protein
MNNLQHEFIVEKIIGKNINTVYYDIISDMLKDNKTKEIMRNLVEYNYNPIMLDIIINYHFQNNDLESLNNNYIIKIKNENILGRIFFTLGEKYRITNNYEEMIKYYLLAITNNFYYAAHNLGTYYLVSTNKLNEAEIYLLIGVNNNVHKSYHTIAKLYIIINNFENVKKYLLLCFNKFNCPSAVHQLAYYYDVIQKNSIEMIKYYDMAIKENHIPSMHSLGNYYKKINDFDNLKKYYEMAINYNDIESLFQLADYYYVNKINYNLVIYYCELAINYVNYSKAWFLLGKYYLLILKNEIVGIKMLEKSISLGYFPSYIILANFEYDKKNYEKMFEFLNKALDHNQYTAYNNLAIYYINVENNGDKLKEYALLSIDKKNIFGELLLSKYYKSFDYNLDKMLFHINQFFKNIESMHSNNISFIRKILNDEDIIEISKLSSELPIKFKDLIKIIKKKYS